MNRHDQWGRPLRAARLAYDKPQIIQSAHKPLPIDLPDEDEPVRHSLAPRLNRAWTGLAIFTVALVVIAFGQAFARGVM